MRTIKNDASFFDDDFEVTYIEDDITSKNSSESRNIPDAFSDDTFSDDTLPDEMEVMDTLGTEPDEKSDFTDLDEKPNEKSDFTNLDKRNTKGNNFTQQRPRTRKTKRKGTKSIMPKKPDLKMPHLLSPAKNTAKYSFKAIYHTARFIIRTISLLLIAGITGVLAYHFWQGMKSFGAIQKILSERNYTLAAYIAIAVFFLLFEVISFLWAATRIRIREGLKIHREDSGRGLFSFLFIYIASYLSFQLSPFLPKSLWSTAVMSGIREALEVFGALHSQLLVLCAAGVVSCLIRKYIGYLNTR